MNGVLKKVRSDNQIKERFIGGLRMSKYIKSDNFIYNKDDKPQCVYCSNHRKYTDGTHYCNYGKLCVYEKEIDEE